MDLSAYYHTLTAQHQNRYLSKISIISVDPYTINVDSCDTDLAVFPKILYPDIVNYLVFTSSTYTMDQMCAYKSLEAYNQSVCGWVRKVGVKHFGENILILGKVMHSQRLREKLLSPWILAEKNGKIVAGHCDCVAGLGEVCTHVAADLFNIDEQARKQEEVTRTFANI